MRIYIECSNALSRAANHENGKCLNHKLKLSYIDSRRVEDFYDVLIVQ